LHNIFSLFLLNDILFSIVELFYFPYSALALNSKQTGMKFIFSTLSVMICLAVRAQDLPYTVTDSGWNVDSLGNQRVVVQASGSGLNKVTIYWRRPDANPDKKRIILQDQKTGALVTKILSGTISGEKAELWFDAVSGVGLYYIYYMPYKNEGRSNYPRGVYLAQRTDTDSTWMNGLDKNKALKATALEIQSINAFNSLYPMEEVATKQEEQILINAGGQSDYLLFPESRMYPVVLKNQLPYRWIKNGPANDIRDTACRGENFSFQLGMYALKDLSEISVSFSDLKNSKGDLIHADHISCLNTSGTDYTGKTFTKKLKLSEKNIQALWCMINVPVSIDAGLYSGTITISAKGSANRLIPLQLKVKDSVLQDGGISEPWKQTRLRWLNSTMAQENTVIAPYIPLQIKGKEISLLGRKVIIGEEGFPKQIQTFFTPEMTGYQSSPNDLLSAPIQFIVSPQNQNVQTKWKHSAFRFDTQTAGTVTWTSTSTTSNMRMDVFASMEFDGFIAYTVKLTALQDIDLNDISMYIPFAKDKAKYMMGLGLKGSDRKSSFDWKWEVAKKNQDGAWIGDVNAGLQYSLRDEKYVRPLNTNFYLQKPLILPTSWGNDNKGGITISETSSTAMVKNYSGSRTMKKGDTVFYNFNLLITPFHPINTDFQWSTRFYHRYNAIDSIKATGATVINIHHATPINPWINYPFIEYKKMKMYIDSAHALGLKVKIYNTVRELSDRAYELFPMRSLGNEIYSSGKGGGFSWLQEHVIDDYIPAWFVPEIKDAALVNSGMSRWHNYYVEGMNWLVQNVGIDGIYLDDVAFDRITMKRIKRVLTNDNHPGIIDLHSANQYNKNDGFNNSANLYMEHFPYLNRLWFGEYFDYNHNDPSFFLTEVSGIPFGLMGEMLQDGGNPWRGMVYGMTNRLPWSDDADPRAIWKTWDDFGMQGTSMIGYWSSNCPVKTSNAEILATVYQKKGAALISIASWAASDTTVQLIYDWKKLGLDPATTTIMAPGIKNFQQPHLLSPSQSISIEKSKGIILVLKQKQ
jgi:Family of unknown function (DUF6067)